jgi:CubicO group peptidase (beta-lactamase class C family)
MKRLVILTLVFFCLSSYAIAQVLPTTAPEDVGMSSERLDRINPNMQKYVDEGKLSGVLTMVARRGKIVHLETFGKMDIAKNKPLTENTIFRIYSMSKPITSIAVMILYEEGHFHLDAPVSKFIPEFKELKVYKRKTRNGMELEDFDRPMTIRNLLTHTAGLSYGWGDRYVDKMYEEAKIFEAGTTLKQMIQKLGKIPLVHQPGTKWEYSVAVDVLGYLVEVISGMPFEQFLSDRLFKPLGMVDTGFSVPKDKRDRFAELYRPTEEKDGIEVVKQSPLGDGSYRFFPSGGGGLVSTASDYMRFCQMLLNGGELDGVRILGRKTVDLIRSNHVPDEVEANNDHSGFGLGFAVEMDMAKSGELASTGTYRW